MCRQRYRAARCQCFSRLTTTAHNYEELHKWTFTIGWAPQQTILSAASYCEKTNSELENHTRLVLCIWGTNGGELKSLFMAHCRRFYGKITQPSDKLVLIDSESETSAPAAVGMAGVTLYWLWKWHMVEKNMAKKKEHIETITLQ